VRQRAQRNRFSPGALPRLNAFFAIG
jgi:hypothetical protein